MSETDNSTEPHVSGEELRAALAPRDARRNPVLVTEHDDGELKQLKARARDRADGLRSELEASRRLIDSARADAIELRAVARSRPRGREGAAPRAHPRPRRVPRAPRGAVQARSTPASSAAARCIAELKARNASSSYLRRRRFCMPPSTNSAVPVAAVAVAR